MKSKTSYFNFTVFKKDITRFAPAWVLYTIALLLVVCSSVFNDTTELRRVNELADLIAVGGIIAFLYAPLNAQLLFGDLCNPRLCNAMHAMPLRRECWFSCHIVAGLLFALIPNLLVGLLCLCLPLGAGWFLPLLWILATFVQYLFFFGLAVLCMMLVGNRFAQILLYGITNFFSPILYWLASSLYEPLLHGICISDEPFYNWTPLLRMTSMDLVDVVQHKTKDEFGDTFYVLDAVTLTTEWRYMALFALLGMVLIGLALVCYRRRKLECAGDFVAFRFMEPIFLILYTVCAGAFLHLFSHTFGMSGNHADYVFLAIGILAGFFTGLMMLRRTTRVFHVKTIVQFALLAAVCVLSLIATWLDPLRITYYVPDPSEVQSVTLSRSTSLDGWTDCKVTLTDEAAIADLLSIHRDCLNGGAADTYEDDTYPNIPIRLEYHLSDGRTLNRFYSIDTDCAAGQLVEHYFSTLACVLGITEEEIPQYAAMIEEIAFPMGYDGNYVERSSQEIDIEQMLRAIAQDCAEGHMAQPSEFHFTQTEADTYENSQLTYIEFGPKYPSGQDYVYLRVYAGATHTIAWLEENNLMPDVDALYG